MNGRPGKKRTCVVCGKEFTAKGNQKTCSFLCSDSPKNLRRKGRKGLQKFLDSIND